MENQSSLRSVFGSTFSLSELNDEPAKPITSGYSRFGLNEHPPSHQMHTKVRRSSNIASRPKRKRSLKSSIAILFTFGVFHSWVVNFHMPVHINYPLNLLQKSILLSTSGLLSVFAGFLVADSDSHPKNWLSGLMRGYGGVLGLIYLTRHLPPKATTSWILINPSLWYISDRTVNGFLTAFMVTFIGTVTAFITCRGVWLNTSSWLDFFIVTGGIVTAYFGTSLLAGNIGRLVCKRIVRSHYNNNNTY